MEVSQLHIRRAQLHDAAKLALVGQATFLETFAGVLDGNDILEHGAQEHSLEYYQSHLARSDAQLWLAETPPGQAPIGYLMTSKCSLPVADVGPDDVEIKRIYVLHRFHGSGVGARLMQTALDCARGAGMRRVLLGVYAKNERAISFYQRHGFQRVGQRQFSVGANRYDDVVLACLL
jgi:ribosomal protein S18 acetylase RimI-like enzyme